MSVNLNDVCHIQVLAAAKDIAYKTGRNEFTPDEIIAALQRAGSKYAASTIRTHVVSRCCVNAPDHHAVVYHYFERIGPGVYKVL
jgi:hypothetical protein